MDRDEICAEFLDTLEFDPYPFQEEALLAWFETDDGLLVTAPTGMGKTLLAEAAIYEALVSGKTLYYTTPLQRRGWPDARSALAASPVRCSPSHRRASRCSSSAPCRTC